MLYNAIIIAVVLAIAAPAVVILFQIATRRGERPGTDGDSPETEEGDWGGDYVLDALRTAYASLKKQGAGVFGQWIPACIERAGGRGLLTSFDSSGRVHVIQTGGAWVPPEVALTALRLTRSELSGSRFDLSVLDGAIASLERQTGEGE